MTRFLTFDHVYDAAFATLPHSTPQEWFERGCFGTADFLDVALRAAGHEATTLVQNFYASANHMLVDAKAFQPDVIISREAGRFSGAWCRTHFPDAKLICTCSHRVDDGQLAFFNCVFSSFPWMPGYCRSIGVRCEYLPLAFGRPVLERIGELPKERDIPVAFVGGLGPRIWLEGTKTMAAIAEAVPDFIWHGYVAGALSDLPVSLQRSYRGELWGADAYRFLCRTEILLNRHGEIAARSGSLFGNNNRQFEGPGCGCILLTDHAGEMKGHCATYQNAGDAIDTIKKYAAGFNVGPEAAARSQEYVLANHCYENRVGPFLSVIESL